MAPGQALADDWRDVPADDWQTVDYGEIERQKAARQATFFGRMGQMLDPRPLLEDPAGAAKALFLQPGIRANQAIEAARQGQFGLAAGRAMQAVPVLGIAAEAGERVAADINQGNLAGAGGTMAGLLAPNLLGSKLPRSIPVTPAVRSNPKANAAMATALAEGVPVSLAAATDSRFVRAAQELSDSTLTGSPFAAAGDRATKAGFEAWAGRAIRRAEPDVPVGVEYADWNNALTNPRNELTVRAGRGMKKVVLPVNIRGVKNEARQFIRDRAAWPAARKQSDPAYALAEAVAFSQGDYVPAQMAELALSGLKSRLRELGTEFSSSTAVNVERGAAAGWVAKLQQAIDRDVGAIDPKAAASLKRGRAAAARQAGADWLQDTFEKATSQGEWSGAQGLWRRWQNLDPGEKKTMYPNPLMRDHLESLFLAAKRAENVSSGSRTAPLHAAGHSAQAVLTGGAAVTAHPVLAILGALGPAAFSYLAHNPRFVAAATRGLRIPVGNKAALTIAAGQIWRMAAEQVPPHLLPAAAQAPDQTEQIYPIATTMP